MSAIPYGYVDTFAPAPSTVRHAAAAQQEVALLHRAQAGDEAAFEGLYEAYRADIYNFVYRFMSSAVDADDLTQDAFVKAWVALSTPGTKANTDPHLRIGAWLYRIATNVCLDELRHRKLVKWQTLESFLLAFHPAQVAPDSPERDALRGEDAEAVRRVLLRLPEPYRRALVLREFADLSYDEIAKELASTRAAVKSVLLRARDAFCAMWQEEAGLPIRPRVRTTTRYLGGRTPGPTPGVQFDKRQSVKPWRAMPNDPISKRKVWLGAYATLDAAQAAIRAWKTERGLA